MVDVKCKAQAKLSRTPVFISSNSYPWLQAPSPGDRQALTNRMIIFHCATFNDLANYDKPLNPGMWWNICQAIDNCEKLSMYDQQANDWVESRGSITVDDALRYSYSGELVFDLKSID